MVINFFKKVFLSFDSNIDFIVKTLTVVASVGGLVSIIMLLSVNIDSKIHEKLNDPDFVRKISKEIKIQFLIFNDEGAVVFDGGAAEYVDIEKIVVKYDEEHDYILKFIRIKTKNILNVPPLVTSIGVEQIFEEATRIDSLTWEYRTADLEKLYIAYADGKRAKGKFKLELLK